MAQVKAPAQAQALTITGYYWLPTKSSESRPRVARALQASDRWKESSKALAPAAKGSESRPKVAGLLAAKELSNRIGEMEKQREAQCTFDLFIALPEC